MVVVDGAVVVVVSAVVVVVVVVVVGAIPNTIISSGPSCSYEAGDTGINL